MSCTILRPDPQALFNQLQSMFSSTVLGGGKVIPESNEWYVVTNDYAMAEQYYAKKKYNYAQQLYEDVMPYYRGRPEFEDIYYKYAYCAYYMNDFMNAENLFKTFLEIYPNSPRGEEVERLRR